MRKLLILCFFLPLMAWGQSVTEIRNADGSKYIGEVANNAADGEGIEYKRNGTVSRSGRWKSWVLVDQYAIDPKRFPFEFKGNPTKGGLYQSSLLSQQFVPRSVKPECETNNSYPLRWDNCVGIRSFASGVIYEGEFRNDMFDGFGTYRFADGRKFVGFFKAGQFDGLGIMFRADGSDQLSGTWSKDSIVRAHSVSFNQSQIDVIPSLRTDQRFLDQLNVGHGVGTNWRERLDRVIQSELRQWLSPVSVLDEVPAPSYPAALALKQEPWESNKEFEDRVEKARTERRQTIDRLQAEYKSKVDERNRRVAEFNKQQQERQAQLPHKRRELIQLGISVLNPAVSLADPAFDQQSGALTVAAQVDGLGKQTFSFK
ncbi:MAG: hypothetical protein EB116_04430, partial [Betaproteobacteria bacterium]|nr:hypothetical protein [Betaproteobacteria bacterium]